MPFPSTRVIPDGWSQHHQPVVADTLQSTCQIYFPSPSEWPPPEVETPDQVLYEGPCRVQSLGGQDMAGMSAETQVLSKKRYLVVVPADAPIHRVTENGPFIDILTPGPNGDGLIVDRRLVVQSTNFNTLRWERDLFCEDDLRNQPEA